MSATGEVESPAVEKEAPPRAEQQSEPAVEEQQQKKKTVSKEKKPRAPKTASHPPYFQMIKEALLALNEKDGSSPYAIAKYIEEKHKAVLPANFKRTLALQLKNSAAKGKLIKIRASFKLSKAGKGDEGTKNERSPSPTKKPEKKETTRKAVGPKKLKKSEAAVKPKQPKSIRASSSSKKAKRAAAA